MIEDLRGRAAFVSGGGSGIGRATALALAGEGVDVVVADIDEGRALEVAGLVNGSAAGGRALGLRVDVNSADDFQRVRDQMLARFGRVDIVMNNVGVIAAGLPDQIPLAEWERIISTNLMSVVRSNEVFLPLLLERGSGHIVNTGSTAGLYAYAYERLPYSATKAAVVALSEALALYLRPRGIGVTCLCPGPVTTNIVEQVTVSGAPVAVSGPALEWIAPEVVAGQVIEAIKTDTFLLLTHPEVHDVLVRRAHDPEGFLAGQISLQNSDGASLTPPAPTRP